MAVFTCGSCRGDRITGPSGSTRTRSPASSWLEPAAFRKTPTPRPGRKACGGWTRRSRKVGITPSRRRSAATPYPAARIRERYPRALRNLIQLLPDLAHLRVYDNSTEAASGEAVPDPVPVLEMQAGTVISPSPDDAAALSRTPAWARAIVEAALLIGLR
ncbi:MAG: hypothetical protein WD227_17180 [Vicinamibacterales bacterium]